jgi:hypothetical protein
MCTKHPACQLENNRSTEVENRDECDVSSVVGGGGGQHFHEEICLTESVYQVVLHKSIPTQIRQLIVYHY